MIPKFIKNRIFWQKAIAVALVLAILLPMLAAHTNAQPEPQPIPNGQDEIRPPTPEETRQPQSLQTKPEKDNIRRALDFGLGLISIPANLIGNAFLAPVLVGLTGINTLLGYFLALESMLLDWIIEPGIAGKLGYSFNAPKAVKDGWKFSRDFANLGLVIALIIIAIATILRVETYGMQKTLVRLIAVALLVNFSFLITGLVIDVGNLLTLAMLRQIRPETSTLAQTVMFNIKPQQMYMGADPYGQNILSNVMGVAKNIITVATRNPLENVTRAFFTLIFLILLIVVFGALMVMFLIRRVVLWILIILSPIVFLLWIFEGSRQYWREWWEKLIQWNIFGPVSLFFVWLSINLAKDLGNVNISAEAMVNYNLLSRFFGTPVSWILQMITFVVVLMFGLVAAQRLSIIGADIAVKQATAVAKWPGRMAGGAALRGGREAGQRFATSALGQRVKEIFAGMPVLGHISRTIQKMEAETGKDVDAARAELEAIRQAPARLADIAAGRGLAKLQGHAYRVAAAQLLAEQNLLNTTLLSDSQLQALFNKAQSISPQIAESMLLSDPINLLPVYNNIPGVQQRTLGWAVNKVPPAEAHRKFNASMLQKIEVAREMSVKQLQNILDEGTDAQIAGLKVAMQDLMNVATSPGAPQQLQNRLNRLMANQYLAELFRP